MVSVRSQYEKSYLFVQFDSWWPQKCEKFYVRSEGTLFLRSISSVFSSFFLQTKRKSSICILCSPEQSLNCSLEMNELVPRRASENVLCARICTSQTLVYFA